MEKMPKLLEEGKSSLAPYSHFGFCPVCGASYKTWKGKVSFRCFNCESFIEIKDTYPKQITKIPSCRWFGKSYNDEFQEL